MYHNVEHVNKDLRFFNWWMCTVWMVGCNGGVHWEQGSTSRTLGIVDKEYACHL